ncbi:hypothetical protein ACIQXQ_20160 [Peribacillus sp. NPDC097198]|uniref:hypothetical protein n=1 Tax=Peribacillus sp. NPDC097198 TaxID=3364397 RepID=UPI00381FC869
MRLPKKAYLFEKTKGEYLGKDIFGDPVYAEDKVTYSAFDMEIEPYSPELAKSDMAINVTEVKNLMYTYPDSRLEMNVELVYKDYLYRIIYPPLDYDTHYEILLEEVEPYNPSI